MSALRKVSTPNGIVELVQCECRQFVLPNEDAWFGRAPLPEHAEWRPTLVHLFAEGRPWLLDNSFTSRVLRRVIEYFDRLRAQTPCRVSSVVDHSKIWETCGLGSFGPRSSKDAA